MISDFLLNKIAELIKEDEGFSSVIYLCIEDKRTIGYGRNIDDNPLTINELNYLNFYDDVEKISITKEQAEYLLKEEIKDLYNKISNRLSFFEEQHDFVKYVLINVAINCGLNGMLKFKKTLDYIKNKDYKKASIEILDSKAARELENRYNRLSLILKSI